MLKSSDIRGAYLSLWQRFAAIADEAGLVTKPQQETGFTLTSKDDPVIVADAFVYLPNWPYKAVSKKKKKIHVLLQSSETYNTNTEEIIKSRVQLGYFDIRNNKVTSSLQLHYDFDHPAARAHPVFHVQLGAVDWPKEKCDQVGFPDPTTINTPHALYSNARIPTPHMGFCAALLALAADHLDNPFYKSFLSDVRKNRSIQWKTSCKAILNSYKEYGDHPHSHHWY